MVDGRWYLFSGARAFIVEIRPRPPADGHCIAWCIRCPHMSRTAMDRPNSGTMRIGYPRVQIDGASRFGVKFSSVLVTAEICPRDETFVLEASATTSSLDLS